MKKNLQIIFAAILIISIFMGCAKRNSLSEQNGVSGINTVKSMSEQEEMPDNSFTREEYQKLLSLQFDNYEDMTVSDYQTRIWELTDTAEYRALLERFSKSETLFELKDTNDTAAYLFYVLEPLTAEKWETRDYSGYAATDFAYPADNAVLEYDFTLKILDADALTVQEYNDMRLSVISGMERMLEGKTEEDLQNESMILNVIQNDTDSLIRKLQTDSVDISIEYAYFFPFSLKNDNDGKEYMENTQQQRTYANGTKEDYQSLLALKTKDYRNMTLTDFNMALLEWANEDYDRMERIGEDTASNVFPADLSTGELSFVKLTVFLSGMENGKYVQSNYTGRKEENPVYHEYLPQRMTGENECSAWCSLYYQFSYSISDKETVTVGERDSQIEGMLNTVQEFWNDTDMECLLKMSKSDITEELEKIAAEYSFGNITITIDREQVYFESMDERIYEN